MKPIIIVESPTKAKTINKILDGEFTVIASYGHVRDLEAKPGSILLKDQNLLIKWNITKNQNSRINDIVNLIAKEKERPFYIATDPDREGEAIGWHIEEILKENGIIKPDDPVKRIYFNEITKSAIEKSFENITQINKNLVNAYLARRIVDYLVGFSLSPILWRKLYGIKSAGRVQSVALRLVVEREKNIQEFESSEYWTIEGTFGIPNHEDFIKTELISLNGLKNDNTLIFNSKLEVMNILEIIPDNNYFVSDIKEKTHARVPLPPFNTSSLQQEASNKLNFNPSKTMKVAQSLYEGIYLDNNEPYGLITYMRTDSIKISEEFKNKVNSYIKDNFGKKYVFNGDRIFKNKNKNPQESHEAIRPTDLFNSPSRIKSYLKDEQFLLYNLIWNRTISSHMENALVNQRFIYFSTKKNKNIIFLFKDSKIIFDGFLKIHEENTNDRKNTSIIHRIKKDKLNPNAISNNLILKNLDSIQHFTKAPSRYSEASLISKLEDLGIGRPSTYASIVETLKIRGYIFLKGKNLIPEERGKLVTIFLLSLFSKYIEYDFTSDLEFQLDKISSGELSWLEVINNFWSEFNLKLDKVEEFSRNDILEIIEKNLLLIFSKNVRKPEVCPICKKEKVILGLSRFGLFFSCLDYKKCEYKKSVFNFSEESYEEKNNYPINLCQNQKTEISVIIYNGPYGPYIEYTENNSTDEEEEKKSENRKYDKVVKKSKCVRIPPGIDPLSITYKEALMLKEFPKILGFHNDIKENIVLYIGKYGPYIKCGNVSVSIKDKKHIYNMSKEEALSLLSKKKEKRREKRNK